jgi:hypothetical protein
MARFAGSGEKLDPELRREVLALGPAAIPGLLRLLNDDALHLEDSPGGGWPPIHAVGLLADLKATEAIGPMLRLLCESDWDAIIHDRIILRMHELGPAVVEPALALLDKGAPEDVHHAVCCVLAKVGVRDPRIYAHLCALFDAEEALGATCLADYGDPAALPILEGALEDFEPDLESPYGLSGLADLVESYELLGGKLTPELGQHVAQLEEDFTAYRRSLVTPVQAGARPGRNDPCPCGSGKKYKRCCLT